VSGDRLSSLQWSILERLAGLEPQWTLTGGGALAGFHLKHRTTRDLDLFWHKLDQLGPLPDEVRSRLVSSGFEVATLQTGTTFSKLRVSDGTETCIVDLVADPVDPVEAPIQLWIGTASLAVDTPHEILVNKLGALLGRSELRDLEDVEALLASGGDLDKALADAPKKDGGFSPLTLAWVLKDFRPSALARIAGIQPDHAEQLDRFKESLIQRILAFSAPGQADSE
jgi:hypothetical protein